MSPPAQKALPAPVTISARSGASVGEPGEDHGELADHLRAHRVEGLGPVQRQGPDPVLVDLDLHRLQLRWTRRSGWSFALPCWRRGWLSGPQPTLWSVAASGRKREALPRRADRRAAPVAARRAGRLPLLRSRRRAALRRQGALDPQTDRLPLLRRRDAPDLARRPDRHAGHRQRGRGAARRAELHQAPPAALQHPPARRQVLPLRRGQPGRGLPAGLLHPREAPPRPRLLRPLLQRQARARDARPARQALPVPHLRGRRARPPLRQPLPRLLHQALRGALRRLRQPRRSTGATSTRSSTSSPAATARSRPRSRRRWRTPPGPRNSSAPRCTATG